eukprot:2207193-Prymnesium_polylepis.1
MRTLDLTPSLQYTAIDALPPSNVACVHRIQLDLCRVFSSRRNRRCFDSEIRVTAPPGERRKEGAKHMKT